MIGRANLGSADPGSAGPEAIRIAGELLGLDAGERERLLGERCARDAGLERQVRALLDAGASLGGFMEPATPALHWGVPARLAARGTRIAGYEIGEPLGSGSSAEVYEGVPVGRGPGAGDAGPVAIKIFRPGAGGAGGAGGGGPSSRGAAEVLAEARAMARLDHPAIARLIDSGTATIDGAALAFLVMELVPGPTVTVAAATLSLSVPQRLGLLAGVCDGVEHAHRRMVLHRDLKPANVLVALAPDGVPRPKIVDFGLAVALRTGEGAPGLTALEGVAPLAAGSLAYMSPERLEAMESGDTGAADARWDVYSLGVMLFELLTGRLPHPIAGRPVLAMIREVRESEAPRIETVAPALTGDLSRVVAGALAKEPARRYASAGALGEDLRRVLRGEPVSVRRPGTLYQLRRAARRRPVLAAVLGVGSVTLLAGACVSTVQWARASRAEAVAVDRMEAALAASAAIVGEVVPQLRSVSGASDASTRLLEGLALHMHALHLQAPDDPRVLRQLWLLNSELGVVSSGWTLRQRIDNAVRSRELLARLALLEPDDPAHAINLHQADAWIAQLTGVADRAALHRSQLATFHDAMQREADPARRARIQMMLAYRLRLIAGWEEDAGGMAASIDQARQAYEAQPDDPETSCELGSGLAALAAMLTDTDRAGAARLALEAQARLLEARDKGLGDHESIVRQLGGLEIQMARIFSGTRPAHELLALAGSGLSRHESFARNDPGRADMRRDWGYQLAAYARAAVLVAARADSASRDRVRAEALARLEASIREYQALPPLEIGTPDQDEFVARAYEAAGPLSSPGLDP